MKDTKAVLSFDKVVVTTGGFSCDWVDTNTFIPSPNGDLQEAGTCVLINNSIVYLSFLSEPQLQGLKQTILEAVDHELRKRSQ